MKNTVKVERAIQNITQQELAEAVLLVKPDLQQ